MVSIPIKLGKYIHFKGSQYEVVGEARHTETLEEMVVYRALYGNDDLWVRPMAIWNEVIEHEGRYIKRFTHIDDEFQEFPQGIHNHSNSTEK